MTAYAPVTYTSNGIQTRFTFPFPYVDPADVDVRVNSVLTTAWTFFNSNTVELSVAAAPGSQIQISRSTKSTDLVAEIQPGSAIPVDSCNDNWRQSLYLAQESQYAVAESTIPVTVVDNLLSTSPTEALSANQGRVLRDLIDTNVVGAVSVKSYGAIGDGVANDTAAIQAAINSGLPVFFPPGTYCISSVVRAVANQDFVLDALPGTVTIKSISVSPLGAMFGQPPAFLSSPRSVRIRGLTFDGEHIRTSFPYSDISTFTAKALTAFSFVADPNAEDSVLAVSDCRFLRFPNLPLVVDHFKRAIVTGCQFIRTKDPGFRFCQNVQWIGNHTKFGADNGVSVSRGCQNVVIGDSIFEDCEVNGIWVSGFNVPGTGAFTVSGASYAVGAELNLTTSGGATLGLSDLNTLFTLTGAGSVTCVVKLLQITSSTTGIVGAITAVPAALQNTASTSWTRAPMTGVDTFTASNNVVIGAYIAGLHAGIAPKKGVFSDSVVVRSGAIADSEVDTLGRINAGSSTLTLDSATGFAALDWVIVKPSTSLQEYFIARISTLVGTTATLDRPAPRTYIREEVRLLHLSDDAGWGLYVTGNGVGETSYAENIDFKGVSFIDYRSQAAFLGASTLTSVRNIEISDCTFDDPSGIQRSVALGLDGLIRIAEPVGLPVSNIVISNNRSSFPGDPSKPFVRAFVRGTTRRSIVLDGNYLPNVTDNEHLVVNDLDNANANITRLYAYSRVDSFGIPVSTSTKAARWTDLTAAEVTALASTGVFRPVSDRVSITPTAPLSITSVDWSLLGGQGLAQCCIENESTVHNITIVHNDSAIRLPNNTNIVLGPRDYIELAQRSTTVSYKMV